MAMDRGRFLPIDSEGAPQRRLGERVQVFCAQHMNHQTIVFYTNDVRIPMMEIPYHAISGLQELQYSLREYIQRIVRGGFATPYEIDVRLPNMYRLQQEVAIEQEKRRQQV